MKMKYAGFGNYLRRKSQRGQLKIQQMAFMLIAVVLFFALVGVVILSIKLSSLKETAEIFGEEDAMLLVTKLANSPEFSCGNAFGSARTNCIDGDKVIILKKSIKDYSNFWGVDSLEIRKISGEPVVECDLENYPECNRIELIKGEGIGVGNFVVLCHKELDETNSYDKCELAQVIVSYDLK